AIFDFVNNVYIQPNFPGAIAQQLGAPQQLYPLTGVHNGFFDPSVQAGVTILDDALKQQLADGNHVVVYGDSQGATIETLEMENLAASANPPSPDQLNFVLTGDPDLPNGGMLERFDFPGLPSNLTLPSLGVTFYGATPADTPYPTAIYTGEYDGFADFPRYPINLLADINALLGIPFVHGVSYFSQSLVDQASVWQTSPGYDGDTTYYLIPTENLPLLDLLRGNPLGNAIADLLQPDLKVLVNLGYGPDNTGYSEYPNVYTPASGLFPDVNPATVLNELVTGAQQGIQNFLTDLKGITPSSILAAMTNGGSTVTPLDLDPSNFITELQTVLTENSNALATLIAGPLDTSTPAVDALTALVLTLPTLNANL
ncbi:MAG: PE-PPE domain-containing protein, partial [bacterium]